MSSIAVPVYLRVASQRPAVRLRYTWPLSAYVNAVDIVAVDVDVGVVIVVHVVDGLNDLLTILDKFL